MQLRHVARPWARPVANGAALRRGGAAHLAAQPAFRQPVGRRSAAAVVAAMRMSNKANTRDARPENAAGDFFVDHTCIDCDTCRWMAPGTFARVGEQSAVSAQPSTKEGRVEAMKALLSCPTFSIHVQSRTADELQEAQRALPSPIPGCPGVYYTGWTTEKSYAGMPYLIIRPGGNILVDSPRFNPVLLQRIRELGGARYMFLTHRDDVGDHARWAEALGATRILHELEANSRQGTDKVEIKLRGQGPWVLRPGGAVEEEAPPPADADPRVIAPGEDGDVTLIFTPGHTAGHVCLYYAPAKALFTGDHLCASYDAPGELHIFENVNWYSVDEQRSSVAKLLSYDWLHVLPAHGRRTALRDAAHRLRAVSNLVGDERIAAVAAAAGQPRPEGAV